MRVNLPIKLISLVAIGVASTLVTSSILAQGRGSPRQAKPAARGVQANTAVPRSSTTTSERPLPATEAVGGESAVPFTATVGGEGDTPIAAFWLKYFDVKAHGQDVFIDATAGMRDTRMGINYFWSLRVTNEANRNIVLSQRHYTDQVFAMPAEREMSPTFGEYLRLGPGDYQVEISLFQVPADANLANLLDNEWSRRHQVIRFARRITIIP